MSEISKTDLEKYEWQILQKHCPRMPLPSIEIRNEVTKYGGLANYGFWTLTTYKWMMKDAEETKGIIRHELAHFIVRYLRMPIKIAHGKEFHKVLKQISPKTWKQDLHWHYTPAIIAARTGKEKKYKRSWQIWGCVKCEYQYPYRRVPYYIKAGLSCCPKCKSSLKFIGKNEYPVLSR